MTTLKLQTKSQPSVCSHAPLEADTGKKCGGHGGPYRFLFYLHPGSHSFPSQDTPRAQSSCAQFSFVSFAVMLLLLSTDAFHKDTHSFQPRPRRPFCGSVRFPCAAGPPAACVCPPWPSWRCWCSRAPWRIPHDTRVSACWSPRRSSWCFRPSWPAPWTQYAAQDNRRQPFESWIHITKHHCFKIISHQVPISTFQNFFTFTLLPGSSTLLQTPECSEYHPSKQSPVVSALSLTRLQLFGTSSLFLSFYLSVLSNLPWKPFSS